MARITRRRLLAAAVGLIAAGRAHAQSSRSVPVIGLLDAGERLEWWSAFRGQLQKLGYIEGRNISIEGRYAKGDLDRLRSMAEQLAKMNVAVIVVSGSAAALAAKRATSKIPIVTATGADQLTLGLAVSLSRPGRNVTGVSSLAPDLTRKRLGLLRELLPKTKRLAVLWHSDNIGSAGIMREVEAFTESSKIELQNYGIQKADELPDAFAAAARERAEAVFVVASPYLFSARKRIAELALEHRLPTVHGPSEYVDAGGLLSYGPSYPHLFVRAADYVDKILRGANPATLPIERATKFELVINLKTARALGIPISRDLLARADRVIE